MNFLQTIMQKLGVKKQKTDNKTSNELNNEQNSQRKTTKEKQQEFLRNLNINTNELLNPVVCKGDRFIPNILISLGADEKVVNNEIAISHIKPFFIKMMPSYVLEKIEYGQEFTSEEIEDCVRSFFDKTNEYNEMLYGRKSGKNITISEHGIISTIDCVIGDKDKMIIEQDFYMEGNNLVINKREGGADYFRVITKQLYNSLGVLIGREERKNTKVSDCIFSSITRTVRDDNYPFIVYKKTEQKADDDKLENMQQGTQISIYPLLNSDDCVDMKIDETVPPIKNSEEILDFYEKNKEQILNMFISMSNFCWVNPLTGIRKSSLIDQVKRSKIAEDYEEKSNQVHRA